MSGLSAGRRHQLRRMWDDLEYEIGIRDIEARPWYESEGAEV